MNRIRAAREAPSSSLRALLLSIVMLAYIAFAAVACRLPRQLPRLCLFHWMTGRPCPFCGLTRAVGLCTRGNFRDAIGTYPVAFCAGIAGLVSMVLINRSQSAD